jgi:hypothetical protein
VGTCSRCACPHRRTRRAIAIKLATVEHGTVRGEVAMHDRVHAEKPAAAGVRELEGCRRSSSVHVLWELWVMNDAQFGPGVHVLVDARAARAKEALVALRVLMPPLLLLPPPLLAKQTTRRTRPM